MQQSDGYLEYEEIWATFILWKRIVYMISDILSILFNIIISVQRLKSHLKEAGFFSIQNYSSV